MPPDRVVLQVTEARLVLEVFLVPPVVAVPLVRKVHRDHRALLVTLVLAAPLVPPVHKARRVFKVPSETRVSKDPLVPPVPPVRPDDAVPRVLAERLARKERKAHVVRLVCGASQERQVLAVQPV